MYVKAQFDISTWFNQLKLLIPVVVIVISIKWIPKKDAEKTGRCEHFIDILL